MVRGGFLPATEWMRDFRLSAACRHMRGMCRGGRLRRVCCPVHFLQFVFKVLSGKSCGKADLKKQFRMRPRLPALACPHPPWFPHKRWFPRSGAIIPDLRGGCTGSETGGKARGDGGFGGFGGVATARVMRERAGRLLRVMRERAGRLLRMMRGRAGRPLRVMRGRAGRLLRAGRRTKSRLSASFCTPFVRCDSLSVHGVSLFLHGEGGVGACWGVAMCL